MANIKRKNLFCLAFVLHVPFLLLNPDVPLPDRSGNRRPCSGIQLEPITRLHATGVEVHQAEDEFLADGVRYPAGTYILYCSQPYRSHLNDMMERQVYPNRSYYPEGPPEAPYDMAGWTLPLQMGVHRVSVFQPFEARVQKLDTVTMPQGRIIGLPEQACGYVVHAGANDNYPLNTRVATATRRSWLARTCGYASAGVSCPVRFSSPTSRAVTWDFSPAVQRNPL